MANSSWRTSGVRHAIAPSRRCVLHVLGGGAALLAAPMLAQAPPPVRQTPILELGPFYPVIRPEDTDADLTVLKGSAARAQGQVIYVSGRVLDARGEGVPNAALELWQADMNGRYAHPDDPNKAPLDGNFQGFALLRTDAHGFWRIKTVKPGEYPTGLERYGTRTPHIHFDVTGRRQRKVTQMFFPDEPLNGKDYVLQTALRQEPVIARRAPLGSDMEPGALAFTWDLVIRG